MINIRTTTINITELDNYIKLIKLERELACLLHYYNESQKLQLARMERIHTVAGRLADHKGSYKEWFKTLDPEVKKAIDKARLFH